MTRGRWRIWGATVALVFLGGVAPARAKLAGWATPVEQAEPGIQAGGPTLSTRDRGQTGAPDEPGAFALAERERSEGKSRRPATDDQVIRFPARGPGNPGRAEFSHLRHFNALGEKQCKTCHSPEMGLLTSPSYASRVADPVREPHGPKSLGRFCASCHNGKTHLGQVGALHGRRDAPIFTAAKASDPQGCHRCHVPANHGRDFTRAHAGMTERRGPQACLPCHAQNWGAADRRLQAHLLAAQRTLAKNPDDAQAALAIGPNNFCVSCHRRDAEWQGEEE